MCGCSQGVNAWEIRLPVDQRIAPAFTMEENGFITDPQISMSQQI